QEYSIHTIEEFEMNGFALADGDSLYIDSVIPRFSNMVEVRGAVMHEGQYQMDGKIQSVRDLVQAAEGLREDAFTERAVMHREKEDLTLEMISIDIRGIMDGSVADVALKKNDVLFIPSKTELTGEQTLRINGEVNFPGTYEYAENTTIQDLIILAGGLTRAASTAKIDVFRRNYQPGARTASNELAQVYTFNLDHGFMVEDTMFVLLPFDEVQVRKSPTYEEQQNVKITGSVNFEGEYAMTNKEFRLSDLVHMAGGLSELAYAKGARLLRQMTQEEREQRETSLRTSQIALYEQALESDKQYDRHLADSLQDLKMNLGYNYPVAINLDEALAHPGEASDILLRANDQVIIPQFSNTVKISGEVMYPISINYKKGKGLSYYIKSAGGYSNKASKSQTYAIYMNGSTNKVGRRARKDDIQPGCEIVIPTKPKKEGMTTAEISVLGTSAASLTTMVVALINLLK
ncbi:MAG: SLBB domain-containing protein, partial [Bacteroidaceae bacterium]|nr:SLBB domain-containing protein [Bacteroidaceae bacterium]